MTDLTDLLRKGLDQALEQHVVKLFTPSSKNENGGRP
jgi:hypothetical protein